MEQGREALSKLSISDTVQQRGLISAIHPKCRMIFRPLYSAGGTFDPGV